MDVDFRAFFSNLAENLGSKLSNPSNKYNVLSLAQYHSHVDLTKTLIYYQPKKDYMLKLL